MLGGLVMKCIISVQYSVLYDGEEFGSICPKRGLRQGDPLSPYLSILCAEGFTALIKHAESQGDIHGVKVCRRAPSITNLLFADDSFLFSRATVDESLKLRGILEAYERASGQKINLNKSAVSFSANVEETRRNEICNVLGVSGTSQHGKYLGLLSLVGRSKKEIFAYLKERAWKKNKITEHSKPLNHVRVIARLS